MLVMIDNYDSFTYMLVNYLESLAIDVAVFQNDAITVDQIRAMKPSHLMISPGPCTPNEAGVSLAAIEALAGEMPILGVCLGHQAIGQVFGAKVIKAKQVMHGKTSQVHHQQQGVFAGLNQPFTATRYHSLVLEQDSLPDCFEVTAWTALPSGEQEEIMAIRHKTLPIQGVQFHPESILSEQGLALLSNFINGS